MNYDRYSARQIKSLELRAIYPIRRLEYIWMVYRVEDLNIIDYRTYLQIWTVPIWVIEPIRNWNIFECGIELKIWT